MHYIIIIALVALDQTVKYFVRSNMSLGQSFPVISDILHITHISNSGGAFSILQGQTAVLVIIPTLLIAIIMIYMYKKRNGDFMLLVSLSLICGGGAGNLIDRVRLGAVVDYIDFRIFPVFNIADICVCCGCGLMLIYILIIDRKEKVKCENVQ